MAAPSASTSSGPQAQPAPSPPSADAIASLITQVSPNGQPARAPARATKPRTAAKKKPSTTPAAPAPAPTADATLAPPVAAAPVASSSTADVDARRTDHDAHTAQPSTATGTTTTSAGSSTLINAPGATPASSTLQSPAAAVKSAPAPARTGAASPARSRSAPAGKGKKKPGLVTKLLIALGCASPAIQQATFNDKDEKASSSLVAARDRQAPAAASGSSLGDQSKETLPESPLAGTAAVAAVAVATTSAVEMTANQSRAGAPLPRDETGDVLSAAVVAPGADGTTPPRKASKRHDPDSTLGDDDAAAPSAGQTDTEATGDEEEDEEEDFLGEDDDEDRIIAQGGIGIPIGEDGLPHPLLTPMGAIDSGRKCLVLDLDETLVHSSFKMVHQADFIVPVEIENQSHNVYVIKRPGVDNFLKRMGEIYEVVIFTASLSKYADPVLDCLDIHHVVRHRLFRESCYNHRGNYVKDLSQLGRPIGETIIIDNSPASYIFHPKNAVPVSSWFNDPHDTELTDLANVLTDLAAVPDVRGVLDVYLSMS